MSYRLSSQTTLLALQFQKMALMNNRIFEVKHPTLGANQLAVLFANYYTRGYVTVIRPTWSNLPFVG